MALVDDLLEILERDPAYASFMLDGQAILLEDYLEIRPEREGEIRRLVGEGRLQVGPWYILPDEFLVSAESLVRNLLLGRAVSRRFGAEMPVGYTPDPFGHVGQLPQLLRGFGLEAACLQRGLDDEPAELTWEAPDGSRVLLAYLREGYGNAAYLPTAPDEAAATIARLRDALEPHAPSGHLLLLHGTDHQRPTATLPALLRHAEGSLAGTRIVHGTLPGYLAAVAAAPAERPLVRGELRSSKRWPLLPGVLSARTWIKLRMAEVQTLLERHAEPLAALSRLRGVEDPLAQPFLRHAWRLLLQNQPHDSVCGCSVDAVHEEMRARFERCAQVAAQIADAALDTLAGQLATEGLGGSLAAAVWAPVDTDVADVHLRLGTDPAWEGLRVTGPDGLDVSAEVVRRHDRELATWELGGTDLVAFLETLARGVLLARVATQVSWALDGATARVELTLADAGLPDLDAMADCAQALRAALEQDGLRQATVTARLAREAEVRLLVRNLPAFGLRALAVGPGPALPVEVDEAATISNEHLLLDVDPADGTFSVADRASGRRYVGLGRLESGGDRGDEYNHCPPLRDRLVAGLQDVRVRRRRGPLGGALVVEGTLPVPAGLTEDREGRLDEERALPVRLTLRLLPGARHVELELEIDNAAEDHRLRLRFPTGHAAETAAAAGHFETVRRPLAVAADTEGWAEDPSATHPHAGWAAVDEGDDPERGGLLVAAPGLPEYEAEPTAGGVDVLVTLLRCVGWLSRDDLRTRPGNAGPMLATPGAQCRGPLAVRLALVPYRDAAGRRRAERIAAAHAAPPRAVATGLHDGPLPPEARLLALHGEAVPTALKPAEDGDGAILRVVNLGPTPTALRVSAPHGGLAGVSRVRLDEEPLPDGGDGAAPEIPIRAAEIASVRLRPWDSAAEG